MSTLYVTLCKIYQYTRETWKVHIKEWQIEQKQSLEHAKEHLKKEHLKCEECLKTYEKEHHKHEKEYEKERFKCLKTYEKECLKREKEFEKECLEHKKEYEKEPQEHEEYDKECLKTYEKELHKLLETATYPEEAVGTTASTMMTISQTKTCPKTRPNNEISNQHTGKIKTEILPQLIPSWFSQWITNSSNEMQVHPTTDIWTQMTVQLHINSLFFEPWNKKKHHKQEMKGHRESHYMNSHWMVKEFMDIKTMTKMNA